MSVWESAASCPLKRFAKSVVIYLLVQVCRKALASLVLHTSSLTHSRCPCDHLIRHQKLCSVTSSHTAYQDARCFHKRKTHTVAAFKMWFIWTRIAFPSTELLGKRPPLGERQESFKCLHRVILWLDFKRKHQNETCTSEELMLREEKTSPIRRDFEESHHAPGKHSFFCPLSRDCLASAQGESSLTLYINNQ